MKARIWRAPYTPPRSPSLQDRINVLARYGLQRPPPERPWHWRLPARSGYYEGTCLTHQDAIRHVNWLIAEGWHELPLERPYKVDRP